MTRRSAPFLLIALATAVACGTGPGHPKLTYPEARTVDVVDDYNGVKVADPYRWLEDIDSPEVHAWVEAENALTRSYLDAIPARAALVAPLDALYRVPSVTQAFSAGTRVFWLANDGSQAQDVIWVQDGPDAEPRVLLDPNGLSADGTIAVFSPTPSPDGSLLAYALSDGGSDWRTWRVRDVATGDDRPDRLEWSKFSNANWAVDGRSFTYAAFDQPAAGSERKAITSAPRLMRHRIGTPQAEDELVYQRPDEPTWMFHAEDTEDGRWQVLSISRNTARKNMVLVRDLHRKGAEFMPLIDNFDAGWDLVTSDGDELIFRTDDAAPLRRVVAIDARHPKQRRELVSEGSSVLTGVTAAGDTLIVQRLVDATAKLELVGLDGAAKAEVALPGPGAVGSVNGRRSAADAFFTYQSFITPPTIYRLDPTTGSADTFRSPDVPFDPADFVTEQVWTTSKDGTKVPMFVSHLKRVKPDGNVPVLLQGYGGFDVPVVPRYRDWIVQWLRMGGVFGSANLRGGSEYGDAWHDAGRLKNKQNVFDDFIGAAEWFVSSGWSRAGRIAINGGSNGGLLVGAVLNQRPDLFTAAIPEVGVMDMLRFDKFTIGWAWVSDYGSPEDPEMFPVLRAYSPYHNVKKGTHYPAVLVMTSDHDDRVVPGHSFKYTAAMQAAQAGDAPILLRVETRAGHGAGKPVTKQVEEAADKLAFLVRELGMKWPSK